MQALNLTELLNSTAGINLTGVPLVANISLSGRNRTVITASAVAAATAAAGHWVHVGVPQYCCSCVKATRHLDILIRALGTLMLPL